MNEYLDLAQPLEPDDDDDMLNAEQNARIAALALAQPLIIAKSIGTTTPPDVDELIKLAGWIIDGAVEPLYPFQDGDLIVLGPKITVALDGSTIFWDTTAYHKEEVDEL